MPEVNPPLHIQARTDHTAVGDRQMLHSLFPQIGGVAQAAHLAVTENGTPNMSVNVAAGKAFIVGSENSLQGTYHVWSDGTKNLTISAADATNPRIDLVVAKVQDAEYSGVTNAWSLAVVTGTPAASPSAPTAPANSIILAQISVPANDTAITNSQITDRRNIAKPWGAAWGIVASAELTSTSSSITSEADISGLSVTFTAQAGRRYAIHTSANMQSTVATDEPRIYLNVDGSNVATVVCHMSHAGRAYRAAVSHRITGAGVSVTAKIRGQRSAGSGTVTCSNSAANFSYIYVEDLGPA